MRAKQRSSAMLVIRAIHRGAFRRGGNLIDDVTVSSGGTS